jgi:hypothetical protein
VPTPRQWSPRKRQGSRLARSIGSEYLALQSIAMKAKTGCPVSKLMNTKSRRDERSTDPADDLFAAEFLQIIRGVAVDRTGMGFVY